MLFIHISRLSLLLTDSYVTIYSYFVLLVPPDVTLVSLWSMCRMCNRSDCLLCSVPVLLHSHLLSCLPVFDSRQVSASLCWLTVSFLQHPCSLPTQSRQTQHMRYTIPSSLFLPASTALFICPTVCVGDVNYLYRQPPLLA